MSELIPLGALLPVLLVGSAFASGSETALFSLTHAERARLLRESPSAGAAIEGLLSRPRALLIFVLLLNMTANVGYFVVTSVLTTRVDSGVAGTVVGLASVLLIILFGEVLAKMLARAQRVALCRSLGVPMRALQVALDPLVRLLDGLVIGPIARLVGGASAAGLTRGEVAALMRTAGDESATDVDAIAANRHVLEEVIVLGARRVRDVMKPRVRLGWVGDRASVSDVRTAAAATRRTVLAVRRGGGEGPVCGLLHVKPFLSEAELNGREPDVMRYCDEPVFVPENARLDAALGQLRRRAAGMLLCVDEHGDVSGWLEPEDIADELLRGLGEDEPTGGEPPRLIGLGRWAVSAEARVHEIERQFGFAADALAGGEALRATTLGGLMAERLGRVPGRGDVVRTGVAVLTASRVTGRRVDEVEVELVPAVDGGGS